MSYFGVSLRNGIGLGLGTVPSLSNTPLAYRLAPTLTLSFAGATALDPRITFTRASSATFTNSAGLVALSPINLLTYSEQFDNVIWTTSNGTVTANSSTAPDGATTADKFTPGAASAVTYIREAMSLSAGTVTLSVYLKTNGVQFVQLMWAVVFNGTEYVNVDLVNGTITAGTYTAATITPVGSGWYRCTLTSAVTASAGGFVYFNAVQSGTAARFPSYTGDGTSGIFLWGAQLQTGSTATTYIPTVATATGAARFDYDPVTRQPKGLLIEEARTNVLTYSEQFDNAAWAAPILGSSVTANTDVAPDGTLTADTINFSTTPGNRVDNVSATAATNGVAATFSVWLKGSGTINIAIQTSTGIGGISEPTITLTNTWTRYLATFTPSSPTGNLRAMIIWRGYNTATSCQAWGAQLEAGAFATSYIPTVAAQATRAAENAVMTGTNFSSWYNQTEGTVFEEADVIYTGNFLNYPTYFRVSDGSSNNYQLYGGIGSLQIADGMQVAGVNQLDYAYINRTSGFDKLAFAYQANNTRFTGNGISTTTDTVCSIPTVNRIDLGNNGVGGAYLNGHIKRITYWPRRLSNAELQAVTR